MNASPRRAWTPREKILAWGLALGLFIFGNLLMAEWLQQQYRRMVDERSQLKVRVLEAKAWKEDQAFWEKRASWLEEKQPRAEGLAEAGAAFLNELQKGAASNNLTITEQSPSEPESSDQGRVIAVRIVLTGRLEGLIRWMAALQQPSAFCAIRKLSLKVGGDEGLMKCEMQIQRIFAPEEKK